jgi:hypothetical protein
LKSENIEESAELATVRTEGAVRRSGRMRADEGG